MKRWVQNPPSWRMEKFVAAIVVIALIIAFIEHFYGWPDWLTPNEFRRIPGRL